MSLKPTTLAAMLMALAGILPVVGCSGDECTKAADHFAECMPLNSSGSGPSTDPNLQCDGQLLCRSRCINAAGCDAISGAFDPSPSDDSVIFIKCSADCNNK
jgi:hypothetical protein